MRKIALVQSKDRLVNQLQQNIVQGLAAVFGSDVVFGRLLTGLKLASGSNTVIHGLDQPLKGWQVVRQRAAASFYDTQDSNTTPATTLLLHASAAVTVDLWVF